MSAIAGAFELTRFGEELVELMRDRGITYRELARRSGLASYGHLCDLARGSREYRPTDALIEACARALDVEPDYFTEYKLRRVLDHAERDVVDELYERTRRAS